MLNGKGPALRRTSPASATGGEASCGPAHLWRGRDSFGEGGIHPGREGRGGWTSAQGRSEQQEKFGRGCSLCSAIASLAESKLSPTAKGC